MVKAEAGNPSSEEQLEPSTFDPQRWNEAMGNFFWKVVFNGSEYTESQIEGTSKGFLGQKGYQLGRIGDFVKAVTSSSSILERGENPSLNPIEQKIEILSLLPPFEVTAVEETVYLKKYRTLTVKNTGNVRNTQIVKDPFSLWMLPIIRSNGQSETID